MILFGLKLQFNLVACLLIVTNHINNAITWMFFLIKPNRSAVETPYDAAWIELKWISVHTWPQNASQMSQRDNLCVLLDFIWWKSLLSCDYCGYTVRYHVLLKSARWALSAPFEHAQITLYGNSLCCVILPLLFFIYFRCNKTPLFRASSLWSDHPRCILMPSVHRAKYRSLWST